MNFQTLFDLLIFQKFLTFISYVSLYKGMISFKILKYELYTLLE